MIPTKTKLAVAAEIFAVYDRSHIGIPGALRVLAAVREGRVNGGNSCFYCKVKGSRMYLGGGHIEARKTRVNGFTDVERMLMKHNVSLGQTPADSEALALIAECTTKWLEGCKVTV